MARARNEAGELRFKVDLLATTKDPPSSRDRRLARLERVADRDILSRPPRPPGGGAPLVGDKRGIYVPGPAGGPDFESGRAFAEVTRGQLQGMVSYAGLGGGAFQIDPRRPGATLHNPNGVDIGSLPKARPSLVGIAVEVASVGPGGAWGPNNRTEIRPSAGDKLDGSDTGFLDFRNTNVTKRVRLFIDGAGGYDWQTIG